MSMPARRIEWEPAMNERTTLDEKVEHIQNDVTDLKADVKRIDASLTEHRVETQKSLATLRDETKGAIATLRGEMKDGFAAVRGEMRDGFAEFRRHRNGQIAWMIGTVIAAVGAACAVARLFANR